MVGKFISFVGGVAGAVALSQAPAYTNAYTQNLAGRLAELETIVQKFDKDVAAYGYTRASALAECTDAVGLLDALCEGIDTTVARYYYLIEHEAVLNEANEYAKPVMLAKEFLIGGGERDIAESVAENFAPAVPTTPVGAVYAGGGFFGIWVIFSMIWGLIKLPFGGRNERYEGRWG